MLFPLEFSLLCSYLLSKGNTKSFFQFLLLNFGGSIIEITLNLYIKLEKNSQLSNFESCQPLAVKGAAAAVVNMMIANICWELYAKLTEGACFNNHNQNQTKINHNLYSIIIFISWMRKLRLKEFKQFVQGHNQ